MSDDVVQFPAMTAMTARASASAEIGLGREDDGIGGAGAVTTTGSHGRLSREDVYAFVGTIQAAILTADSAGEITYANSACEALFGYEAGGLIGLDVRAIIPARFHGPHSAGMQALVAGGVPRLTGKTVEVTAMRRDGSEVPIELTLSHWRIDGTMRIGAMMRDISERRGRDTRLLRLAHHDPRTGLPNRNHFIDDLAVVIAQGNVATVLALAIDGLHAVNDTLGHAVGDALLELLVVRLRARLDADALLARTGDDELAILLHNQANPITARICAQNLISTIAEPLAVGDHLFHLGAMVGAAFAPNDGADAEEVVACADLALYQAKSEESGSFRLFDISMRSVAATRRALQDALLLALERRELVLHYQPQVDLESGLVCGAEALIRWQHPEHGLVTPDVFLSAIDASILALSVGWWTIDEACRQNAEWRAAGLPPIRIAVNLFAAQLRGGALDTIVLETLARYGLPPDALEIEVTELIALRRDESVMGPLQRLQARGVGIAFDDFGTGYASLSMLKAFPLTKLKIDRGFVRDLMTDAQDAAIVRGMLDIGRGLSLSVVAEGIETADQQASLLAMGCRYGQGFRFGRALEPSAFAECLAERSVAPVALLPRRRRKRA